MDFVCLILGERRLELNENINNVLDFYGVMSYLSQVYANERNSNTRANQADGTIKFTIYQYPSENATVTSSKSLTVRVHLDDGGNRMESIEVTGEVLADDLIREAVNLFRIQSPNGFKLYNQQSRQYIEGDIPIYPLAEVSATRDQTLILKLQMVVPAFAQYDHPATLDLGLPDVNMISNNIPPPKTLQRLHSQSESRSVRPEGQMCLHNSIIQ